MKNNFLWLFATVLFLGFGSCTKTETPVIEIPEEFSQVTLAEGVTNQTITFQANQSWAVVLSDTKSEELASWLTVSPIQGGEGQASLTLTATDNLSRDERTTYLKIVVDGLTKTIPVKQTAGITILADDETSAVVASKGFFVVNEDWLGHDNGTVNYFQKEGNNYTPAYRVYRAANTNKSDWFGVTTQHATIWGDNAYFSSKQGNRFVVADAKTMKNRAVIAEIGGDGRSFVGIDDTKGYVGHSKGIATFDIVGLKVGKQIEGVSGQIGTMCFANGRVFAISQQNGLYIINTQTDAVEQTIPGSYNTLTRSKDGNVWVAGAAKLIRLDPSTLEKEELDYPDGAKVGSLWGAWNAGGLCASTQQNVLYWLSGGGMFGGGKTVVKFDVQTKTANTALYTLGKSEDDNTTQLEFYGAGLRVDPLTDELILTVKHSGWGVSGAYNWIYKLDANGQEITHFKVRGDNGLGASWAGNAAEWDGKYFWFPAMPFFEDTNKPQILTNQIILKVGATQTVDLDEKIADHDNTKASIQKLITLENNDLVVAVLQGSKLTVTAGDRAGKTSGTLTVISNGVRVSKTIRIDVEK